MSEKALLDVAHLSWQGGVVIGLLFIGILLSKLTKVLPRDLIFTIAGLLTAIAGNVTSSQIYHSAVSQATMTVVGVWMLGKAMQQQGAFNSIATLFLSINNANPLRNFVFFIQAALCGAFLQHRYFLEAAIPQLMKRAENEKWNLGALGFPFAYMAAIGGLATAIGSSTNILLVALFSSSVSDVLSSLFIVLPLSIFPILVSAIALLPFQKRFGAPSVRLTAPGPVPTSAGKKIAAPSLFAAAILAVFAGAPIGASFFCAGIAALLIGAFPVKKTFREEFPLPDLLEIFSAYLFYFASVNSGLNNWAATLISCKCPYFDLSLFFVFAQIFSHLMPRTIAFAGLFSIALPLFSGSTEHILLAGTVIAFAAALPLFGKSQFERAAINGKPSLLVRTTLIFILFICTVIPACLFWSK